MSSPWIPIERRDVSRRHRGGSNSRRGSVAAAQVERLETRELLTLTVNPINTVEGSLFQGKVASFVSGDVSGTSILDYSATINWGDGASGAASITPNVSGGFDVNGSHTYAKQGLYNLSVVLTGNPSSSTATAVGLATVADAPVIVTGLPVTATANAPFTGTVATFTDAGPDAPGQYVATIDWGDSVTSSGIVTANTSGGFDVTGTHTYTASGHPSVTVKVTDATGHSGTATTAANVSDPAPVVSATAIAPFAGLLFSGVVANFTDANPTLPASDFAATIDWGDGKPTTAGTVTGAAGAFSVEGAKTYTDAKQFTTTITVFRLPDNKQGSATGLAVVNNPVITATGTTITPSTGLPFTGVVATFTDTNPASVPANFTTTIDWGDGHTSAGVVTNKVGGGFNVSGTNTYTTANKSYPVLISIVRTANNQTATTTSTATVSDATLTASPTPIAANADQPFNGLVATLVDTNTSSKPADFAVTINWGDGTPPTAGIVAFNPAVTGGYNINGSHTYALAGTHTVVVTAVRMANGQTAIANDTATVSNPELMATAKTITPSTGLPFSGVVATFTDTNSTALPADFTATINWGDGSPATTGTVSLQPGGGGFNVNGTHTYITPNKSYPLLVSVLRASNGQTATAVGTATVSDATLTASAVNFSDTAGQPFNGKVATFVDPDTSSTPADFAVTINWGDGTPPSAGTLTFNPGVTGGYNVAGSHIYALSGSDSVVVTVVRTANNQIATTTDTATVAAAAGTSGPIPPPN